MNTTTFARIQALATARLRRVPWCLIALPLTLLERVYVSDSPRSATLHGASSET